MSYKGRSPESQQPLAPNDATKFLNGALPGSFAQVKDSDLATSDVVANNVTSTAHGFAPKSPASASSFLNGAATPGYVQLLGGTSTITTTGTSTALALPTGSGDLVIFANNASLLTIQGIAAGADGQRLKIFSIGAGQIDLVHQNGSASAANRLINFATSGNTSLAAGSGAAEFIYDATTARWRLLSHEQGDYIDYGATSTVVGWVSRTATNIRYKLIGRSLTVIFNITGTSNSVSTTITLPYTSGNITTQYGFFPMQATDNSVIGTTPGGVRILTSAATVDFYKDLNGAAWANANTKAVSGGVTLQVA